MTARRFNLGLIGFPLQQSLSPTIHHAALCASGLEGQYKLYPVPPLLEGQTALEEMIQRLRRGVLHGLNVTIPHKQNVLPYLDELTPAAEAVGAANTLYMENNHLTGDNTDIPGFIADLKRQLPGLSGEALVLGAGGSARAVVYALLQSGWRVTIAARRLEQAATVLRSEKLPPPQAISLDTPSLAKLRGVSLIVNTTPMGMIPHPDDSPWPEDLLLPAGAAIYDLIYKPLETRLMRQARLAGLAAVNGLGMLVEQGALSFERWTGASADRAAIWAAVAPEA
jgi:shikimate dehydrogenase